ncbi:MAG: PrgI family protein [Candidatus Altiarchaeota archaeon]
MPYAIPANVKYEERVIGPFTLKQSIFVTIGVGISLYVYLGTEMPLMVKMTIISVAGLATIGFAMFDLDRKIMDYVFFFRQPKTTSWLNPAAKKLMNIKSIRADMVFLKDGNALGVLKVRPINFGIMSDQDRDSVIYGFLEFLNSLNFPMQIVMRSVNLDLEDYLRHLKRKITKRDDRIALAYYEHFSDYLRKYITENRINDRHFYIVVPGEKKGDEKGRLDSLRNRCNIVQSNLSLSGIISERMNTHQLINFYSSYFTETFEIHESFISPITMYRKMWTESPKQMEEKRAAAMKKMSEAKPSE